MKKEPNKLTKFTAKRFLGAVKDEIVRRRDERTDDGEPKYDEKNLSADFLTAVGDLGDVLGELIAYEIGKGAVNGVNVGDKIKEVIAESMAVINESLDEEMAAANENKET